MKKILLLICIFCFTLARSQSLKRCDQLLGGNFSFSIYNYNSNPNITSGGNAGIAPSYSWLIKNNLAMGIRVAAGYSQNKFDNAGSSDNNSTSFNTGISVFAKKYKTIKEKLGVYFDHEVNLNYVRNRQEGGMPVTIVKSENKESVTG